MADIALRFHKDMLVLSGAIDAALAARGFEDAQEREILLANEPETVLEPLRLELLAGAQCLVLPTSGITRARLAHARAEESAPEIAAAALGIAAELAPQHVLVEIGSTGLPLDPSRETSLEANRTQYVSAVSLFATERLDAFFLNGFTSIDDVRCAIQGVREVADVPVFASVVVGEAGNVLGRDDSIERAVSVMAEEGASVVGIQTQAGPAAVAALVKRLAGACNLPLLVQFDVAEVLAREPLAADDKPYWCADMLLSAVDAVRASGAQFVRACGQATAAYTGALAAATFGRSAISR